MHKTKNKKSRQVKRRAQNRRYTLLPSSRYTNQESISRTFLDPHKYVSLRYVELVGFSNAATVGSQQLMNLNSIFDPNRTGTGHQPYGFDQLAALYNRYRVLKTSWRVMFGTSTGTYNIVVVPLNGLPANAVSNQTTFEQNAEAPRSRSHVQGGGGAPTVIDQRSISLNDLNGVTKTEYLADDRFEAQVGASPTEVIILMIGIYNPTASTIANTVSVELVYEVDLHDPINLASS